MRKKNWVSLNSPRIAPMHSQAQTAVCEEKELVSLQISVGKFIFNISCSIFLANPRKGEV